MLRKLQGKKEKGEGGKTGISDEYYMEFFEIEENLRKCQNRI
jgi:hypothetical protein